MLSRRFALALPLVLAVPSAVRAADLLTVGEIERITGIAGVKHVPKGGTLKMGTRTMPANGDVNFVTADDQYLAAVNVNDERYFADAKRALPDAKPVAGIGDEAFMIVPVAVYIRARGKYVTVGVVASKGITEDQLKQMASLVIARL